MFINRIGDSFFLISIGRLFYIININFFLFRINYQNIRFIVIIAFICIASSTKSAQIPFSRWLPAAIAAPTPVSSLVHSSTLVTAGLYVLIRISMLINYYILNLLIFFGMATFYLAGSRAICEIDIKKIVALSTLSQLGFIIFCISLNLQGLAFFHLITHAFSKAFFFIITGYLIHSGQDFQDLRKSSRKNIDRSFVIYNFHFLVSIILCGLPNFFIFFSKDYILETILDNCVFSFSIFFIYISFIFTAIYTIRLLIVLLTIKIYPALYMYMSKEFMSYSVLKNSILFIVFIIIFSKLILYLLIFEECFIIEISWNEKNLTFFILIVGFIKGIYIKNLLNKSSIN